MRAARRASERRHRGARDCPTARAARRRSAWTRRATRSAWRRAATSCACARRRRRARSCARCTPRSIPKRVAAGQVCLGELADLGQLLFEHEYGFADGLGGGEAATAPTGPFRRVHDGVFGGPETISCPSCHWVGGPNGAGAETDNAFLDGDGERTASGDERNPPALVGLGVVQALAREMSRDLQRQRADLVRDAARAGDAREARLTAKGVDFGVLRVTPKGEVDASGLRGVDADLVVKPFGWKGTLATFTDFAAEALQIHIGIQSDVLARERLAREVLGERRRSRAIPDGDGVRDELGRGPVRGDDGASGAARAADRRAADPGSPARAAPRRRCCRRRRRASPTTSSAAASSSTSSAARAATCRCWCSRARSLDVDGLPPIDLARDMRQPALSYDPTLGGYPVWLFSDLKRHDMGQGQRRPARAARRRASSEYLTPRLWGVADSAPYLHDGRAPSFDYAIAGHDGEGAAARAAFDALPLRRTAARCAST